MPCCKIGCDEPVFETQEVAFRNHQGYIIRTRIEWCKDHAPGCILDEVTDEEILRDRGY